MGEMLRPDSQSVCPARPGPRLGRPGHAYLSSEDARDAQAVQLHRAPDQECQGRPLEVRLTECKRQTQIPISGE